MSFRKWAILLGFMCALVLVIEIRYANRIHLFNELLKEKPQMDPLNVGTRVVVNIQTRLAKYLNNNVNKIIIAFTRSVDLETNKTDFH